MQPEIILVGGWEFTKDDGIDKKIADMVDGKILLIPDASNFPDKQIERATQKYNQLGVRVGLLKPEDKKIPNDIKVVYLGGGHPEKLIAYFKNRFELLNDIKNRWLERQIILAGSSAGAMIPFKKMLAHGSRGSGDTELTTGLGFIKNNILFIPHWDKAEDSQEWRDKIVSAHANKKIITVDEYTAIFWKGGNAAVVGMGKVNIFDNGTKTTYQNGDVISGLEMIFRS